MQVGCSSWTKATCATRPRSRIASIVDRSYRPFRGARRTRTRSDAGFAVTERTLAGSAAEPCSPPDPQPPLDRLILLAVLDRGPDEERAGDRRRDDDEQDHRDRELHRYAALTGSAPNAPWSVSSVAGRARRAST